MRIVEELVEIWLNEVCDSLSPQDAASKLFHAHLAFVQTFCQGILSSNFDGDFPDPLTFDQRHRQIFTKA